MTSSARAVTVNILDKEFRIACQPGEEGEVLAAARYLDERMREIRSTGKIVGADRIAVIAALNITHELLNKNKAHEDFSQASENRVKQLRNRVELALHQSNQLEF